MATSSKPVSTPILREQQEKEIYGQLVNLSASDYQKHILLMLGFIKLNNY